MDVLVLDKNYETISLIDAYESLIWTDRYQEVGDFELYMPVNRQSLDVLEKDNYLMIQDSDRRMIVEEIEIKSDIENGAHLTVTGRSLESILERRVIQEFVELSGNFQDAIEYLLDICIINPSQTERQINNFIFKRSTDSRIEGIQLDPISFYGENLYDVIQSLCVLNDVGFRVLPIDNDADYQGGFKFELYKGINRSYEQDVNTPVIFSPSYDNILESNFLSSKKIFKNSAFILLQNGDDIEDFVFMEVGIGEESELIGLQRREIFVDASGEVQMYIEEENEDDPNNPNIVLNPNWESLLAQKGKEALSETDIQTIFEGQIDSRIQFVYGRDFFIGDIVQIVNEYGFEARSMVSEVVTSYDQTGTVITPSFVSLD